MKYEVTLTAATRSRIYIVMQRSEDRRSFDINYFVAPKSDLLTD